ncbi:MAG: DEAD/DEAH box helicase [Pyrinomonadaceae bacterium]|nr:DEAD/DEAH box helicase [Pyrinomonadaceae bacterium]
MRAYLLSDPKYANRFSEVWLWGDFPFRNQFGGNDTGVDLVASTFAGEYCAIQCKFYAENAKMDKSQVDSFITTSGRSFKDEDFRTTSFAERLWIATTHNWGTNAENAIKNQSPSVQRLNLGDLRQAPVDWEKLEKEVHGRDARLSPKTLKQHQKFAVEKSQEYFKTKDRGKLIMACGTGKTFTSLRIAEKETDGRGFILFLVPSISLLAQTLREWTGDAVEPVYPICICSDPQVNPQELNNRDVDSFSVLDLGLPASTDIASITKQVQFARSKDRKGMTVVFSTYQSISVIAKVQKSLAEKGMDSIFDLIVCDEAHRTTGVQLDGDDESAFTRVHDNDFIKARRRLYMTATPRLYSEDSLTRAAQANAVVWSMDDVAHYGDEIYRIGFGEAVDQELLTDYKVLVLTLSEEDVPAAVQMAITNETREIKADDIIKLVGTISGLSKQIIGDDGEAKAADPNVMKRAVAFCPSIKASKATMTAYNAGTDIYLKELPDDKRATMLRVAAKHIDGTFPANKREECLDWLKQEPPVGECRVLTNVRCLSEGVDVPSLDAVMFLAARNSQVDVVQSVGRVMRLAPGKKYGYIIIPVIVPSTEEPEKALDNNERYKVVWTVLNALRAHDDRFNAVINQIELNKRRPNKLMIGATETTFRNGEPVDRSESATKTQADNAVQQLRLQFEELQSVVFARLVKKVGNRLYWEQWANTVAEIATRQIARIYALIETNPQQRAAFDDFLAGLRKNINPSITEDEAVQMLSQHIITRPVFDALFEDYSFAANNPVSVSMNAMLAALHGERMADDDETLQKFYEFVRTTLKGLDNAEAKQGVIVRLYENFFAKAFKKMVERLGIVYTPVEVVDFIIHSVNDVLKKEFGRELKDRDVHILDPFTGTGTFITRLIQSGLIDKESLPHKYKHEIFANEIVLLAYYIAAVNIENAYHDALQSSPPYEGGVAAASADGVVLSSETDYIPFEGICLTDTFQLGEDGAQENLKGETFKQNSERVERQKRAPLKVIFGNPPYSVGQKSANDNAQNLQYKRLDSLVEEHYARTSSATSVKALYDSYIKAFRWSTDRLDENGGVISFVSNGAWLESNGMDGFRKSLEKEFSSIYVFNLRGNARTSGELRRAEAGNVFGSGSRTPIAITLLVKNPTSPSKRAEIQYFDIGDYLKRDEKLSIIKKFESVKNESMQWDIIVPNEQGDWINHRDSTFEEFIPIGDKNDKKENAFFLNFYSRGLSSARDAWCYNSSRPELTKNMSLLADFYNEQRLQFHEKKQLIQNITIEEGVEFNSRRITWNRGLKQDLQRNKEILFDDERIYTATYRPFFKQNVYFAQALNDMVYQLPKLFPTTKHENLVISLSGVGASNNFSVLITDRIPDLQLQFNGQCFPLYYYEENRPDSPTLFDTAGEPQFVRRDGVSDFIAKRAKEQYATAIRKEDIFYYVYGFLHSPEYRQNFANDLKKMLPRIPLVDDLKDFVAFSKAGRDLAQLHLNYEKVSAYPDLKVTGDEINNFRVGKMTFVDKTTKEAIRYNGDIVVSNIPAKAYDYVINGKSAIEWIMERYQYKQDPASGIINDPNNWADEVGNPRYILDLLLSIVNVSVQTVDIVETLPKPKFE